MKGKVRVGLVLVCFCPFTAWLGDVLPRALPQSNLSRRRYGGLPVTVSPSCAMLSTPWEICPILPAASGCNESFARSHPPLQRLRSTTASCAVSYQRVPSHHQGSVQVSDLAVLDSVHETEVVNLLASKRFSLLVASLGCSSWG